MFYILYITRKVITPIITTFIVVTYMFISFPQNMDLLGWSIGVLLTLHLYALPVSFFSDFLIKVTSFKRKRLSLTIHTLFALLALVTYALRSHYGFSYFISKTFIQSAFIILLISMIYWLIDEVLQIFYHKTVKEINAK